MTLRHVVVGGPLIEQADQFCKQFLNADGRLHLVKPLRAMARTNEDQPILLRDTMIGCCGAARNLVESWLDEQNFQDRTDRHSCQQLVDAISRRYGRRVMSIEETKLVVDFQQSKDAKNFFDYLDNNYNARFNSLEFDLASRVVVELK